MHKAAGCTEDIEFKERDNFYSELIVEISWKYWSDERKFNGRTASFRELVNQFKKRTICAFEEHQHGLCIITFHFLNHLWEDLDEFGSITSLDTYANEHMGMRLEA